MSKAPLKQWFELQDLHCIVSVVLVASLNNGATLLCILNQVIPMPIFLETETPDLTKANLWGLVWEISLSKGSGDYYAH